MSTIETPPEFRAAFDTLLSLSPRLLRVYDHDLAHFAIDDAARHDALRALCVAGGGRRVEILLDDIGRVVRDHPRLMQLVRDFGHVLEIRQSDADVPRPDEAFVLAGLHSLLLRPDKLAMHGTLHREDAAGTGPLHHRFEDMWQRAPAAVSATTLGL